MRPRQAGLLLYNGFVALSLYLVASSGDVGAEASNLGITLVFHPFAGRRQRLAPSHADGC